MNIKLPDISWRHLASKVSQDDILDMSASLAFYTALSLAPLLVLLLTFLSFIGEGFREELLTQIQGLIGSEAAKITRDIAENASQKTEIRGLAGIAGLITLLFSAGAIFGDLRQSLNRIFEVREEEPKDKSRGFFRSSWDLAKAKLFNMGMVLTFVFISIISLVISSALALFLKGNEQLLGQILNFAVSFFVFWILFSAIFFFLPRIKVRRKVAVVSGFVTAIFFSLGKSLIGLYLGQSAVASLYGAAGSFIVLLLWVYYSSAVIYFSAELSYEMNREVLGEKAR
ncbi:YihY/virulence factor BrkB family protein [Bdellovibrio sp. HCB2-146]|uniref:YihY/virulence factor BrkB family protein n=1 Tax=Bdellovibrio sp. HCB2-146 TaxID=3394362 RepID=UPI0039BCEFE6